MLIVFPNAALAQTADPQFRADIEHLLDVTGAAKVGAQIASLVADNAGSAHVLEKLGMKREACLREKTYFKGRWWDALIYAILADEWKIHKQTHPVELKQIEE